MPKSTDEYNKIEDAADLPTRGDTIIGNNGREFIVTTSRFEESHHMFSYSVRATDKEWLEQQQDR